MAHCRVVPESMRESQSVSPSVPVREPVPVTTECCAVPSPSLLRPSPYAQLCLLLCLDETVVSPYHVEGDVTGHVGLSRSSVYLVWLS